MVGWLFVLEFHHLGSARLSGCLKIEFMMLAVKKFTKKPVISVLSEQCFVQILVPRRFNV